MSPTLFLYVFKQLVKVFLLASGVIAGIMSFGGLLKPLTESGLDLGQVGQMLVYAMPAMTTYSYPIAALFATTIVYGRLAADNEVTAVRAAGISLGPLGLGMPALVLGAICLALSLVSLSYVVPAATLQVERTVVSNLGQFIVNRIEQQHQVRLYQPGGQPPLTIYAQAARIEESEAESENEQVVVLEGVSIVTFARSSEDHKLQIPDEFYIARQARAYIRQPAASDAEEMPVMLRAVLSDGMKFPRTVVGRDDIAIQGGVRTQQFGPFELRSPLRENTKFMDFSRLQELLQHPERSRRMGEILRELMRLDMQREYLTSIQQTLRTTGVKQFKATSTDAYTLTAGTADPELQRTRLQLSTQNADEGDTVKLIQSRRTAPSIESVAREARVRAYPDMEDQRIAITVELNDAIVRGPDYENPRASFERAFFVPMPPEIAQIAGRTAKQYLARPDLGAGDRQSLVRNLMKQDNSVISEMHSRFSFAISCLVLTMVGYGLGVMFKSGNYLNAFAVSVVPALVSIVLIVTGQHICENVPPDMGADFKNPLDLGLVVIWTGNVIVFAIAVGLMVRLRRT